MYTIYCSDLQAHEQHHITTLPTLPHLNAPIRILAVRFWESKFDRGLVVRTVSMEDKECTREQLSPQQRGVIVSEVEALSQQVVEDAVDVEEEPMVYLQVRHKGSEVDMIKSLAAETIQESYRRYKECQSSVRLARVRRVNAEVEHMAADTIKGALRTHISRKQSIKAANGDRREHSQTPVKAFEVEENEDDDLEVPENWERRYDDVKGRHYYVDHTNKKTQWRHPLSKRKRKSAKKSSSPLLPESPGAVESVAPIVLDDVLGKEEGVEDTKDNLEMQAEVGGTLEQVEIDMPDLEAKAIEPLDEEGQNSNQEVLAELPPAKLSDSVSVNSLGRRTTTQASEANIAVPLGTADHLVVDEAFSIAFQEQCMSVRFKPREVLLLLDALDCEVPAALLEGSYHLSASIPSVELPVLHAGPLASVLTTYVRNYGLVANSRTFTLPESQAELAVGRVCGLVSGLWSQAFPAAAANTDPSQTIRSQVLLNCDGSIGKAARPAYWSDRQVKVVLSSMGFDSQKFGGFAGDDLLSFEPSRVESEMDVTQSLLLTRFAVYRQVLQLLDKWWELGHRPGDTYRDVYRSTFLGSLMLPFRGPSASAPSQSGQSSNERESSGKAPKSRPRKRRNSFQGLRKATESKFKWGNVDARQGESVEIAPLESLMQSWVPLNRAYGWGVPLETLTLMGGRIGGKRGSVELDSDLSAVQGCCWVSVQDKNAKQSLKDLEGLEIVHPLPASTEGSLVLVPQMCLRKAHDSSEKVGGVEGMVDPAAVAPGVLVEVANKKVLERALDRFEWWDRPPPGALSAMTGQTAEIISTSELESRRRVGVRILNSDIFDAIPLEALLPVTPALPDSTALPANQEEQSSPISAATMMAPKISARVRDKPKDRESAKKKPIAMAAKSDGYTPPFALVEEGEEKAPRVRPSTAPAKRKNTKPRGKPEVVIGESEKVVNDFYLSELRSPLGTPFEAPQGGDEAVPESSPIFSIDAPVRVPPAEPVVAVQEVPASEKPRPTSPSRLSTSTLQFDSENAKWAMSSSPGRVMPGKKRTASPARRSGQSEQKKATEKMSIPSDGEDKEKDPSLFVQEIGLDSIDSENYQNGVIASPGARRREKRPKTAGPQRVVGRPVLAGRDDIVEWVDGEAFFVAGNARLGAREAN